MKVIIVGGGKLGYYLCKTLLPLKYDIVVIEEEEKACMKIANELEVSIINGDGTFIDILSEAGCDEADVLIAVTGKDEDNLIACQLAKKYFNIERTIARVNNPKNISVFKFLGVDTAVSGITTIAESIEREVDTSGIKTLLSLQNGDVSFNEIKISSNSTVVNKEIQNIKMPDESIIVAVLRGKEVVIPRGSTVLLENDVIITLSQDDDTVDLKKHFLGK